MYTLNVTDILAAPAEGGAQVPCRVTLSHRPLHLSAPFLPSETATDLAGDAHFLVAGTDRGALVELAWDDSGAEAGSGRYDTAAACQPEDAALLRVELCSQLRCVVCVWDTGACAVLSCAGDFTVATLAPFCSLTASGAVSAALCASTAVAAVGTRTGAVDLYDVASRGVLLRHLSLSDWGYSPSDTGAAAQLAWSPPTGTACGPGQVALAVGFSHRGAVVWSANGCRVVHALRPRSGGPSSHSGSNSAPSTSVTPHKQRPATVAASPRWSLVLPTAPPSASPPLGSPAVDVLDSGVAALAWAPHATSLVLCGASHAVQVLELSLAAAVPQTRVPCAPPPPPDGALFHQTATQAPPAAVLLASNAVLVAPVEEEGDSSPMEGSAAAGQPPGVRPGQSYRADTDVLHCRAPLAYVADNWPLTHAAVSHDGGCVAAAGTRGVVLCTWRAPGGPAWRMFSDVAQERAICSAGLAWLGPASLCVVNATPLPRKHRASQPGRGSGSPAQGAELLIFPRARLDVTGVQGQWDLPNGPPSALDASPCGTRIVLAEHDGSVTVLACTWSTTTSTRGVVTSSVAMERAARFELPSPSPITRVTLASHCGVDILAVLRSSGELSALDLGSGGNRVAATDVDSFWVPTSAAADVCAMPGATPPGGPLWWVYGPPGMRLVAPWAATEPSQAPNSSARTSAPSLPDDPAVAFDREAVPVGMTSGPSAVTWLTQRLNPQPGFARADLPWFQPCPRAQPVLPCVLRHLLAQGEDAQAAALAADAHVQGQPHFVSSLEWVLFTTLDAHVTRKTSSSAATAAGGPGSEASATALSRTVALISPFPEFPDVVVSVARKTDEREWRALFAATGSPSALFEACLASGRLRTAACYLLIIDSVEGAVEGQDRALQLLHAALQSRAEYALAGELVRFLRRSGHEATLQSRGDRDGDGSDVDDPADGGRPRDAGRRGSFLYRGLSALFLGADGGAGEAQHGSAAREREATLSARVQSALFAHGQELLVSCEYGRLLALHKATHLQLSALFRRLAHAADDTPVPQPLCATPDAFATALSCAADALGDPAVSVASPRWEELAHVADAALRAGALDHAAVCGVLARAPGCVSGAVWPTVRQAMLSKQLTDKARALLGQVVPQLDAP